MAELLSPLPGSVQAKFLAADYETGGLDVRICPPLSMAVVATDVMFNEIDGFALRIQPPPKTVLAIPTLRDQRNDPTLFNPQIETYLDVHTGETFPGHPANYYVIQAPAARINGFVKIVDDRWVLDSVRDWVKNSLPVASAERTLHRWLTQWFPTRPVVAAHNATFDQKYCAEWMPTLFANMHPEWVCTALSYKSAMNIKKGYKLSDVCASAGHVQTNAHEALDDTRGVVAALRWLSRNHPAHLKTVSLKAPAA